MNSFAYPIAIELHPVSYTLPLRFGPCSRAVNTGVEHGCHYDTCVRATKPPPPPVIFARVQVSHISRDGGAFKLSGLLIMAALRSRCGHHIFVL